MLGKLLVFFSVSFFFSFFVPPVMRLHLEHVVVNVAVSHVGLCVGVGDSGGSPARRALEFHAVVGCRDCVVRKVCAHRPRRLGARDSP